ncbi:DUF1579 domain-containing protein [Parvularcula flava]|uniref:DUF1579 domain-containing protein n=1 Tax=Aquisalinus luteolus TaxID=1566827 RepID=A0A8J3A0N0_9PROT|nr:DUF1579 domain-containing protein [Aquisalinus luteolus]NHK26825.1 DUF1579 domain-containing protein [Aquisalinus luteolus]GGH93526.1 hypothetical protein GCM10011355_05570 [Aquisalinus luteolus]
MKRVFTSLMAGGMALALSCGLATAQESPLSVMWGEWEGAANGVGPDRQPFTLTQTERVGPMLDGEITVVEGRGYDDDGTVSFNAFGIISLNSQTGDYEMRSYMDGRSGTYPFRLTDDGYVWEIPAGPEAIVRYTAVIDETSWVEVGQYIAEGNPPIEVFRMELTRRGDTDWPSAGYLLPSAGE